MHIICLFGHRRRCALLCLALVWLGDSSFISRWGTVGPVFRGKEERGVCLGARIVGEVCCVGMIHFSVALGFLA
jgi:hypothetical protein